MSVNIRKMNFVAIKELGKKFPPGRKSISYCLVREGCHYEESFDICVCILPHFRIHFFSFMTSKSVIPHTCVYAPIPPAFGKLKPLNFSGLGVCLIF